MEEHSPCQKRGAGRESGRTHPHPSLFPLPNPPPVPALAKPNQSAEVKGPRPNGATPRLEQGTEGQRCVWETQVAIQEAERTQRGRAAVVSLFGTRDGFHGRKLFHKRGGWGWFRDDSSTLYLLCTLFQSLLHQLHLRPSGIRSRSWGPLRQRILITHGTYARRPRTTGLVHSCKIHPAHQLTAVFHVLPSSLAHLWCVQGKLPAKRKPQGALPVPGPQERETVKEGTF